MRSSTLFNPEPFAFESDHEGMALEAKTRTDNPVFKKVRLREAPELFGGRGLYQIFRSGRRTYVGQSNDLRTRLQQHRWCLTHMGLTPAEMDQYTVKIWLLSGHTDEARKRAESKLIRKFRGSGITNIRGETGMPEEFEASATHGEEADLEFLGEVCRGFEIDSSDHFKWVQRSLNRLFGLKLAVDGDDSEDYRQALRRFQQKHGLAQTGQLDADTQNKLILDNEKKTPYMGDAYVKWIQAALNKHGAGLAVDGHMGLATRQAITMFQKKRAPDLCADGYVGAKTELRLMQARGGLPPGHIRRPPKTQPPAKPKPPIRTLPTVNYCGPKLWGDVFSHWRMAVDSVAKANDRLRLMKIINRLIAWIKGPEQIWFGNFRQEHFEKLSRNMQQIEEILRDPNLTITCDPKVKAYGRSLPGIRRIKLGEDWAKEKREYEKTQTLIHEAAHIAGIVNIAEWRKYGPACSKRLAQQNCFKAMRNADNYGYYALSHIAEYQSASPDNCKNKGGKVINFSPQRPCR